MAGQGLPGQYLGYEREKRGISVAEVARALRLSAATIAGLERDDYKQLPEAVYVRGYIRSYCKFLGVDAAPVLALHESGAASGGDSLPGAHPKDAVVNEHVQRLTRVWGTVAVLAVVTVLLSLWWRETQLQRTSDTVPIHDGAARVDAAANGVSAAATAPATPDAPATSDAPDVPEAPEAPDAGAWERAAAAKKEAPTVAEAPAVAEAAAPDRGDALYADMKITAGARSWALIHDGARDVVIHRIIPAGYDRSFDGLPLPLYFALGDARGIRLWIDGREYDLSRHVHPLNHTAFFHLEKVPGAR